MKLIIKEYLSLLKESKELDSLLPELLLSMGHETISKAQIGPRQYGVDVASIGIDTDGKEKVFIFSIKQGNLSRTDWNGGSSQAVKPSLDEIIDDYIPTHLEKKYSALIKKVVVVTGGDLKQNVQLNWSNYTKKYSKENEIEFDFWGGDKLALFIEEYILNEYIIPPKQRSLFRKTLALLGDIDYDLKDYFQFLDEILFQNELHGKSDKEILKSFRLIYLSLNIVISWSKNEDNLKPGLLASERTLVNLWGFIYDNDLTKKKKLIDIISKVYQSNMTILNEYCEKVYPLLKVENGLSFNSHDFLQESLILFEQLGIFSLLGNLHHFSFTINKTEVEYRTSYNIKEMVKTMISNHKGLYNPVYDEHIIDISLALFLLASWEEVEFIDEWIDNLISHIQFAYLNQEKYFPISSNNFEDLVELNLGDSKEKEEYIVTSTLIPILAQWCVHLGLIENYKFLYEVSEHIYKNTTLQIWYPDEKVEDFMYRKNAAIESGYSHAPIKIPQKISNMANVMDKLNDSYMIDLSKTSCVTNGIVTLFFISSRHFRMPMLPHFWNFKK